MSSRTRHLRTLLLITLGPLGTLSAQGTDVVRGRIVSDSGRPIRSADVFVTIAPSAQVLRALSDSTGGYLVVIPNGSGEYLLYIGVPGYSSFHQRLRRIVGDTTFVVDAVLHTVVASIPGVRIVAPRARPSGSLGSDPGAINVDGLNKAADGVFGALPPDVATNIDAMALLIPGLAVTPSGVSAFGLAPNNMLSTLNGLPFGAAEFPRDVKSSTRFTTSPWDPTSGGFSSVLANRTLFTGGNIAFRTAHVTLDSPALQLSGNSPSALGNEFTGLSYSQGGTGAYQYDRLFYNYGLQASRRTSAVASLLDLDPNGLFAAGVARDSAAKLLQILKALGVPTRQDETHRSRVTRSVSFVERIDHGSTPNLRETNPKPAWWITGYAGHSQSADASLGATILPTFAGRTTNDNASIQGFYSRGFGADGRFLNETLSSVSWSDRASSPFLASPAGTVSISSDLPGGATGLGSLAFGGNSALESEVRDWGWELDNQTSFLVRGSARFPAKFYVQSRLEGFSQALPANSLGSFAFSSLDALARNAPTSFSRTLNAPHTSGGEWIGASALGGQWITRKLTVTGGVRVDANVFTAAAPPNPTIASVFGATTEHAPNGLDVSPRIGVVWNYAAKPSGVSIRSSPLSQISRGPQQIRAGIGLFRGILPASRLSLAMAANGSSNGTQSILCTGLATPTPTWAEYVGNLSSVPSRCIGQTSFADTAPSVTLFDRHYAPAKSWRASLGWTSAIAKNYVAIDAVYAINLSQTGIVDLNFSGSPQFLLSSEAGRPVFVSPNIIVPTTGAMAVTQARRSQAFGQVNERIADLRGQARQITIYGIPNTPARLGLLTLGYTYADATTHERGFDASTGGDPRQLESAPVAFTPRHQVFAQSATTFGRLGITLFFRATSGLPFTPLVSGDINGDGLSNDRAFIFDPTRASDEAIGAGMRALLTSSPSSIRRCLREQLNTITAPGSCSGPWSGTMNASVYLLPALPGLSGRAHASLSVANVLGGVDNLLHGSGRLRGWGNTPFPDAVLYRVRGFDRDALKFVYELNPRFGSVSPYTTTFRTPFRVTLDVSFDLGRPVVEQRLDLNLQPRPGLKAGRASVDSLKQRYIRQNFSDFYGYLVSTLADSIALSSDQVGQMQRQRSRLLAVADSIYGALAAYLAGLPNNYDRKAALAEIDAANDTMWRAIYAEKVFLAQLLTPGQLRLLPSPIFQLVTVPNYRGRFMYSF